MLCLGAAIYHLFVVGGSSFNVQESLAPAACRFSARARWTGVMLAHPLAHLAAPAPNLIVVLLAPLMNHISTLTPFKPKNSLAQHEPHRFTVGRAMEESGC